MNVIMLAAALVIGGILLDVHEATVTGAILFLVMGIAPLLK